MFDLFWELRRQRSSSDAGDIAGEAAKEAANVNVEIKALRGAIDKLILITRALWEITAEARGLSDEYLMDKVNEIDLRDGKLDGKLITAIRQCSSCRKTLFKGHDKCLYCGAMDATLDAFDRIDTDPFDTEN